MSVDEAKKLEMRTPKSKAIYEKAKIHVPFGVHSTYRYSEPYPTYFTRSKGTKLWDVDGNEYTDYNMGFGVLVAGHAHPVVVEAIKTQAESGTDFGFEWEETPKFAEILCQRFGVDQVRLSNTGAEATMYATRFARSFTGRNKIVKFEGCYHGGNETLLVSVKPSESKEGERRHPNQVPSSKGIPEGFYRNTLVAPFNDLAAVEEIVEKNRADVAGMILEPIPMNMGYVLPKPGFLEGLRKLADDYGFVLIFDEIKTCGKFYGGISEYVNVKPDLITLGKAIGGGVPISAIAGKSKIMETIVPGVVSHAGTFNSNPLCVAAGIATLTKVLTKNAMSKATELSNSLARGYGDIIKDTGLIACMSNAGLSGAVAFSPNPVTDWRSFQACDTGKWFAYCFAMMNHGIIPAGPSPDEQWTVSVVHTKEEIEEHLEAFKAVVPYVRSYTQKAEISEAV
ncbi:MAG TPA: aminotransferase class III-fold pyridoxal phosphate-dependent enzyme [Candidatus Acidoferrales bacterium]|nr:aminotransferase class III-fold pyridoxal phosphate-dependent enzyme [Candidatus Acidoferrales bacterium]